MLAPACLGEALDLHTGRGRHPEKVDLVALLTQAPPCPGVLQVLLPELLALAAQHGGPAPPQPADAEPEEPRGQLEEPPRPAACSLHPAARELAPQEEGNSCHLCTR